MSPLALVHERFTDFAGSEMVVQQFSVIWPEASIHAPIVDPSVLPPGMRVEATLLNRLYRHGGYAYLMPLLPTAMRRMRLPAVDAVLVSHHAFANQVVWATDAPVVSYVHSPARWMWDPAMRAGESGGVVGEGALAVFSALQRHRDFAAAQMVRSLIANSNAVAERISRWWRRRSSVIFPPVDTSFYTPDPAIPREDFVLVAGRLVPYKRPEVAIEAAERAGIPVVVAGDGRARRACEKVAGAGTTFLGRVTDEQMRDLYRRCRCLAMPGEEDFGIITVEAQACGAPVVALGAGGALDTVVPGVTGTLLVNQADRAEQIAGFAAAFQGIDPTQFDPGVLRSHAESFSRDVFRERIRQHVRAVLADRDVA
ncbi:MAG: glycosyltransferase [Candidatus Nanopelagicales bacterium]